jgi:hypothetical protein
MPTLRFDPWEPDYGSSDLIDQEAAAPDTVDPTVETTDWRVITPEAVEAPELCFIDGVRNIDMHLVAEEGAQSAPAAFASLAVGSVHCRERSDIGEPVIRRRLILCGGLSGSPVTLRAGETSIEYEPVSVATSGPRDTIDRLQQEMLTAEGELARRLASDDGRVVCRDGPLTFYQEGGRSPVIGVVKRQVATYLDASLMKTVYAMQTGQRTPIFAFGNQAVDRYAWYARVATPAALEQALVGVVRCEVRTEWGLERAVELANLTANALPRYASDSARDPRAPQNLYPIGALEKELRHRLGDRKIIRRALIEHMHATGGLN